MPSARPARLADLEPIVELATLLEIELGPRRGGAIFLRREAQAGIDRLVLESAIGDAGTEVVVGLFEGAVLGYGLASTELLEEGRRLGRIEALAVHPEARGVGIGAEMMKGLIVWLRAMGCFAVDSQALPGDRQTKNFFESFGLKARLLTVNKSLED